jgi:hypothetical protein
MKSNPGYHILANDDRGYKGFAIFHCFLAEKYKKNYVSTYILGISYKKKNIFLTLINSFFRALIHKKKILVLCYISLLLGCKNVKKICTYIIFNHFHNMYVITYENYLRLCDNTDQSSRGFALVKNL